MDNVILPMSSVLVSQLPHDADDLPPPPPPASSPPPLTPPPEQTTADDLTDDVLPPPPPALLETIPVEIPDTNQQDTVNMVCSVGLY